MTVVVGVASKTKFTKTLESDPSVDLVDLYYQAVRYLRQEDVEVENVEVNTVEHGGSSKLGPS